MLASSRERRSQNSTPAVTLTSAQKQLQFQKFKRIKQSEFQPQATIKKQCKKDRSQEELPKKFLGLCLASYGCSSVFYSVLPLISIGSSDQSLQLEEIQFPSSDDGDCFGMARGVVGSNLYFLGARGERRNLHIQAPKANMQLPYPEGWRDQDPPASASGCGNDSGNNGGGSGGEISLFKLEMTIILYSFVHVG